MIYHYKILFSVHSKSYAASELVAILMGIGYIFLIVCGAGTFIGWTYLPFKIYFFYPMSGFVTHSILMTSLPFAAQANEKSKKLIRSWKYDWGNVKSIPGRETNGPYLRSVIRCLRPVAFQCGSVGPICQRSCAIYLGQLGVDTGSVLVLFGSL